MDNIKKLEEILNHVTKTVVGEMGIEHILRKHKQYILDIHCVVSGTDLELYLKEIKRPRSDADSPELEVDFGPEIIDLERKMPMHVVNKPVADNLHHFYNAASLKQLEGLAKQMEEDRKHGLTE